MANFSLLALLCLVLGLTASTTAAPQRRLKGSKPTQELDYAAMFEQEMTPEQARALQTIMSQESRPTVSGAAAERLKDFGHFASINYCGDAGQSRPCRAVPNARGCPRVRNARIVRILQGGASFGSNNIQNWLDVPHPYNWPYPRPPNAGDISVHKGFTDVYNAIRSQVLSTVRELATANPDYTVVSTGHSLGGALATIAAVDLVGTNTVPASRIELASFHSPRVGNSNLSSLVSRIGFRAIDRIVQDNDIVPSIPPRFLGYEHTVGEKYIMGSTMYSCQGTRTAAALAPGALCFGAGAWSFLGVDMFFGRALGMGCGNNNLV
ncbi:class 3-domain-containing protein [Catenaria anguillulae PL171]|uniref:Class 3-domain-containing protein n=1 Tax=Catenaria anguillulae PL171 TaxID=765915 RepID=A0A1Y2HTG3_9FUNG|nr:class 3-domain-containing protein [Catenaria anguillulae PL171]